MQADQSAASPAANTGGGSVLRSAFFKLIVIAVLVTLLGLGFLGLSAWRETRLGSGAQWSQEPLPVTAAVLEPMEVPNHLSAVGSIRAVQEVLLSPEVAGRVVSINFEAGQTVEQGDLLVQLFDGPERADLSAARVSQRLARAQLDRSEHLSQSGAVSKERLDERRAELDQAVAMVQQLNARIEQRQIHAPFAGELGIRQINLGEYLNPGAQIATLTALDELFVEFSVPQQELAKLKAGTIVDVVSDAYPDRTFVARVNVVEPQIDEDTRNVTVQAHMFNTDHLLRPGMYVTASLVLPPRDGALVLPTTAIMTSAQGDSAVVIRGEDTRQGGTAEIVPVVVGQRIGDHVVVTQGLMPGDVVVTEGQLRVQPGAPVQVKSLLAMEGW